MCYYNGVKVTSAQYIEFKAKEKKIEALDIELQNGFDYSDFPIIKPNKSVDWDVEMALWSFVPSWIRTKEQLTESRKKFTTLNATAENLLESKMYRDAALNRRCLVLSSGFYEWRHYKPEGAKKPNTYPYYISIASDKEETLFFMAGIYQPTVDFETGEQIDSFAIVTTKANALMEQIHNTKNRMPTILTKELAEEWISPNLTEERIKVIASYQYDSEEMIVHTIAKDFRTSLNPTLEYSYEELPPIL